MANTLVTPTIVLREVAAGFVNRVAFVAGLLRKYDNSFSTSGGKGGDTIQVRLPQRFVPKYGAALQTQDVYDSTVSLTLTEQVQCATEFSSREKTLEVDDARSRYIEPAVEMLANVADVYAWAQIYKSVYQAIGSPGAGPITDYETYLDAGIMLTNASVAKMGRKAVLTPRQMAKISAATLTLMNPANTISANYAKGSMEKRIHLGIEEWMEDNNNPVHTTGTFTASTPLVNGANQTGTSLTTDGWASGATSLKEGDVFTVAGVNAVNLVTGNDTGELQQFVVTADISDTTGDMVIAIQPPIITSGQLKTVTASPANNAAITVLGATAASGGTLAATASPQGMIYTEDLGAFVTADLYKPSSGMGVEAARVASKTWKVSMRMLEGFDIRNDKMINRIDMLVGAGPLQPRHGVRVYS